MVDALERRSYVVREPVSGGYELTLKLYRLAHTHSPVDQLLKAAILPMRSLTKAIYESCHLCVLSDGEVLVIAEEQAPNPVRLSVEVGHRASAFDTASGQVLIAFMNAEEQIQFLDQDQTFHGWKAADRVAFRSRLTRIRERGFSIVKSRGRFGVDVSCFVGSVDLGFRAVLAVPFIGGGRNQGRERELVSTIELHANLISKALGLEHERNREASRPASKRP